MSSGEKLHVQYSDVHADDKLHTGRSARTSNPPRGWWIRMTFCHCQVGTLDGGGQRIRPLSYPSSDPLPDYAIDGVPKRKGSLTEIEVKSDEDIVKMRKAGRAAREVLDIAGLLVAPGVTTDAIDAAVHEAAIERGAYPSPLNYRKFPKSCCTSVNEVRGENCRRE